jgi:hypothetical protein
MRKGLMGLGMAVVLLFGALPGVMEWLGRDIPPPAAADMEAARREVAESDNAFTYFLQATHHPGGVTNRAVLEAYLSGQAPEGEEIRELIAAAEPALGLVRRGVQCAVCQMPEVRSFDDTMPYVSAWLNFGWVLAAQARLARQAGDGPGAVEACLTGARFGRLVERDAESLVHYLVGVAIANRALEQVVELVQAGAASETELAELADGLERLEGYGDGLVRAFQAECRVVLATIEQLSRSYGGADLADLMSLNKTERGVAMWFFRRLHRSSYLFQPNRTRRKFLETYRGLIRAVQRPYAQDAVEEAVEFNRGWWDMARPNAVGRLLQVIMMPAVQRTLATKCQAEGLLSGARLGVAIRRFEHDRGSWPENLGELVPDYLATVPRDPFDGQEFRYAREQGRVWSVGRNLTDEGVSTQWAKPDQEYVASRDRHRAEDFVIELREAIVPAGVK